MPWLARPRLHIIPGSRRERVHRAGQLNIPVDGGAVEGLDGWQARERALADVHAALIAKGVIVPVELGGPEESLWTHCDLASFAENRLGELVDPADLDGRTLDRWMAAALEPGEPLAETPRAHG
ncbi:MAG: hypothetical protein ACREMQ_13980 [Longimicrobiales bacterium]